MELLVWEPIDQTAVQYKLDNGESDPNLNCAVGTWRAVLGNGHLIKFSTKMGDVNTNFMPVVSICFVPQ